MNRLGKILNAIVTPFGKTLWTGTWSSGSITVPDSDKYSAFIITVEGYGLIGVMNGPRTFVAGFSTATGDTAASAVQSRLVGIDVNGTTWTKRYFSQLGHSPSGNHGTKSTDKTITSIVGLVPNWGGGGVVKRLLSNLINIFSMRGGVCCE